MDADRGENPGKLPVEVRLAGESDTPQVIELTRQIWGGHDYVPYVWDEWLHDGKGPLVVAESGGQVVGLAKLLEICPGSWWLQGLRTHPELEGRGVATQVHNFLVAWWEQHGAGALRLTTNTDRLPVQRLCEKTGFVRLGEISAFTAPSVDDPARTEHWRPLHPDEAPQALAAVQASPLLTLTHGIMDVGWQWAEPHLSFFQSAAADGLAWQHVSTGRVLNAWFDENWDEEAGKDMVWLMLGATDWPLDELEALLRDLRALAHTKGYVRAGWMAPHQPLVRGALERAGYIPPWDHSMYLYEKRLPG
jgi:GNAT superfamily N-acetyltransferase